MMLINDDVSMAKKSLWRDFVQTAVNPHLLRLSFFQIEDRAAGDDHDDSRGDGGDDHDHVDDDNDYDGGGGGEFDDDDVDISFK